MACTWGETDGGLVCWAGAFHAVSERERNLESRYAQAAESACNETGFRFRDFWRDGPVVVPNEPFEWLVAEDALAVAEADLLLAVRGLPTRGVPLLMRVAEIQHTPIVLLQWPGTTPSDGGVDVMGRISLSTPEQLTADLAPILRQVPRRPKRPGPLSARESSSRTQFQDLRPSRLIRLRQEHDPPLSRAQLHERTGMPVDRIELAETFPWRVINLAVSEVEELAHGLDVPAQTLLSASDTEAGAVRRYHQVWHRAQALNTPSRELKRVLKMLSTRTLHQPLEELSPSVLRIMFQKAALDERSAE